MRKITLLMLIAFMTITAHGQNKLLSSTDEYFDGINGTWTKSYGTNYEYDSNNNLIAETNLDWNSTTGVWENISKTIYTYNAANKVMQRIYQRWNNTTNQFETLDRNRYTYTNGRISEISSDDWNNSNWVLDYRSVINYNNNNLPETVTDYNWDGVQWENSYLETFSYNANNKISTSVTQDWVNLQWVNYYKTIYSYNSNNKLITEKYSEWDVINNIWVESSDKTEYELDANGNRVRETSYQTYYNGTNYDYRQEYTYDSSRLMSSYAHPFKDKTGVDYLFEDFPHVNKVLTNYSYTITNNYFENSSRTTYNYNTLITLGAETHEIASKSITVYPNPTTDFLNIQNDANTSIDKITITDVSGKKVLEQNENTTQINVQNLAKGMYILEFFAADKKEVRKFIKD